MTGEESKAPTINSKAMSPRLRLVAEGIILQHRYHELVLRSGGQPNILKTKMAAQLIRTLDHNRSLLTHVEREGVVSFRDYCPHTQYRGNCPHPDCETYMYPVNFLAWFAYWLREHPEDEEQLFALWCKFGNYPRYRGLDKCASY